MLLICSNAFGLEARLSIEEDSLFLILVNDATTDISISKDFILGECEGFANICLIVTDEEKNELKILSRPMNFDIDFKHRIDLSPAGLFGMRVDTEEVVRRFRLNKGCYEVVFIYTDRKSGVTVTSNTATLIVKDNRMLDINHCELC